jgi:hypothetical protein
MPEENGMVWAGKISAGRNLKISERKRQDQKSILS